MKQVLAVLAITVLMVVCSAMTQFADAETITTKDEYTIELTATIADAPTPVELDLSAGTEELGRRANRVTAASQALAAAIEAHDSLEAELANISERPSEVGLEDVVVL